MSPVRCSGCRDDFYNQRGGNIGGCWSLKTAKIITRYRTGAWTAPTEKGAFSEMRLPDCYHAQGYSFQNKLPDFVKLSDVVRR